MRRAIGVFLLAASAASPAEWKLQQALDAAHSRPSIEQLDLEIALSRARKVEAMGKRRLELSPQMGLLALTNPVALATSLGAGLIFRSGSAAPPTVLDAEIDVVAAEIAAGRRRFARELEVTRAFFDTAENGRSASEACQAMRDAEELRAQLQVELSAARITEVEVLRHEQQVLDRTADCRRAERRGQRASGRLAARIGVPVDQLRIAIEPHELRPFDRPLHPSHTLVEVALAYRAEPSTLRGRVGVLKRQVDAARGPNPVQLSVRYLRVGGQSSMLNPLFAGSGLLPEVSTRISLRPSGELTAEKRLLLAKLSRLELELDQLEDEIRDQVTETQFRYESTRDDMAIARKRHELAVEHEKVTLARLRAGLESSASLAAVMETRHRSAMRLVELEYAGHSTLATLFSLCGIRDQPRESQELLIAAAATR